MGDIFVPLLICFIFFVCILHCCKRKKEGTVFGQLVNPPYPVDTRHPTPYVPAPQPGFIGETPSLTITTHHVASPVVNPPYPVDPRHPTPYVPAPQPGFIEASTSGYPPGVPVGVYPHHHTAPYPANITPYPTSAVDRPDGANVYPPVIVAPYPVAIASAPIAENSQPPSYYEATGQAPAVPMKQSPYNPHY